VGRQRGTRRLPLRYWISLGWAMWQLRRAQKRYKKMALRMKANDDAYSLKPGGNGPIMDNGNMLRATTCLVMPNGSGYPFCTIEHLAAFCLANTRKKQSDWRIGQSTAKAPYCSHCAWCGRIIRTPNRCVVHQDDPCPKFLFAATRSAVLIVQDFVALYNRPPYDSEMAQLENVYLKNPHLTPFEIVRVIDVVDDDGLPEADYEDDGFEE
jgi:hypothetical protein